MLPGRFEKWLAAEKPKPAAPWLTLDPTAFTGKTPLKKLYDGSWLASGKADKAETYTITGATSLTKLTTLRIETLRDESLPKGGSGRSPEGKFKLNEVTITATPSAEAAKKGAKPVTVKLKPGKTTDFASAYVAETPFGFEGGSTLSIVLKFDDFAAGRVRLAFATSDAALEGAAQTQARAEILAVGTFDNKNRAEIVRWFRKLDKPTDEAFATVERSLAKEPKPPLQPVFSATSGRGGDVHYLIRGETERKNGVATPGFVQVLTNGDEMQWLRAGKDAAKPPRVALADWLVDSKLGAGHLLARVIVNRMWQHHFGKGLVRTPNDFGAQGEPPTHPELLDYLATELIKGGWKLKPIHTLIMQSATYQQGSDPSPTAVKADPQNRLWWHVPPRRLEAEAIRDSLLAVGGSLDPKMYGPGTLDENSPRRSVYLTVKRSRLVPMLQAFDAPEPIQSVGERSLTTATTQALMMMNSRLVRQQAENLARTVKPATAADIPAAVEKAYRIGLGRAPTDAERRRMSGFILMVAGDSGPKGLETATADFCQVLLCLNEFLYVD